MDSSVILARAPSNIALIKYMGKEDSALNLPANGSLSMTLDRLCTRIELRAGSGSGEPFAWIPDAPMGADASGAKPPVISEAGRARYLAHAQRVSRLAPEALARFGIGKRAEAELAVLKWEIRTANNFPSDSGIASSASSFAALTLAVAASLARDAAEFNRAFSEDLGFRDALAAISRQGSGSSCRSFGGPWVEWRGERTESVRSALPEMTDLILIAGESKKEVSSSDAHLRVTRSPLWSGRPARAEARRERLRHALGSGDLEGVSRISWEETWEMHSLFHTSPEPFTYWEPGTVAFLKWLAPRLRGGDAAGPGPAIATMDAGPNVHLLVPSSSAARWRDALLAEFADLKILEDRQGSGASLALGAQ